MNYEGILEFHGTWRSYQARVLQNVSRYLSDDKIHIVAAPGSGKTTLGIELIKRLNANTLILAPPSRFGSSGQQGFRKPFYATDTHWRITSP